MERGAKYEWDSWGILAWVDGESGVIANEALGDVAEWLVPGYEEIYDYLNLLDEEGPAIFNRAMDPGSPATEERA